jgi:hypothetical protein
MALFALVLEDRIGHVAWLFPILLAAGLGSVVWWCVPACLIVLPWHHNFIHLIEPGTSRTTCASTSG